MTKNCGSLVHQQHPNFPWLFANKGHPRRRRTGVRGEAPGLPQSPAEGCWPCQAAGRVVRSHGCGSPGTRGFPYLAAASAHLCLHPREWKVIAEARAPARHPLTARSQKEGPGLCQVTNNLNHADGPVSRIFRDVLEPTWEGDWEPRSRQGGGALTQRSAPPSPADRNAAKAAGPPLS